MSKIPKRYAMMLDPVLEGRSARAGTVITKHDVAQAVLRERVTAPEAIALLHWLEDNGYGRYIRGRDEKRLPTRVELTAGDHFRLRAALNLKLHNVHGELHHESMESDADAESEFGIPAPRSGHTAAHSIARWILAELPSSWRLKDLGKEWIVYSPEHNNTHLVRLVFGHESVRAHLRARDHEPLESLGSRGFLKPSIVATETGASRFASRAVKYWHEDE